MSSRTLLGEQLERHLLHAGSGTGPRRGCRVFHVRFATLGYEVTAFVTLEIRQAGGHDPVAERLAAIPEVHTIMGPGTCSAGWWPGPTPASSV